MSGPHSIDRTFWKRVRNYPYAGLDFLLDEDLRLVFIEANAVPGGIYVMNRANKLIHESAPRLRSMIPRTNYVRDFVRMSLVHYHFSTQNNVPRKILITTPINGSLLLMPERVSILREFARVGIEAYIANRSKYYINSGVLLVKLGSKLFVPDMVIRRNTCFPKGIRQPVINSSEIGIITGSKFRTYRIVCELLDKCGSLRKLLYVPRTYYSRSLDDAVDKVGKILKYSDIAVVKPNMGEGGRDIVFIKSVSSAMEKLRKLFRGGYRSVVIQEMINAHKLSIDGRSYVFDIRAYAYLGELVGFHGRRCPMPVHVGSMEGWAISNVSRGGKYLPILTGDGVYVAKWSEKQHRIYPFRGIYVDKFALIIDYDLTKKLQLAVREIVIAISQSLSRFWDGKNAA